MARVIENVARDGVEVERMHARFATVEAVSADDETLVYVLGEETVVWLAAGEHHVFDRPTRVLLAAARESGGRSGAGA
jgi:hypothetical protein